MSDDTLDDVFAVLPQAHQHYRELDAQIWDGRIDPELLEPAKEETKTVTE